MREQGKDPYQVDFADRINDVQSPSGDDTKPTDEIVQSADVQEDLTNEQKAPAANESNATEQVDLPVVRPNHVRETRNYRK